MFPTRERESCTFTAENIDTVRVGGGSSVALVGGGGGIMQTKTAAPQQYILRRRSCAASLRAMIVVSMIVSLDQVYHAGRVFLRTKMLAACCAECRGCSKMATCNHTCPTYFADIQS